MQPPKPTNKYGVFSLGVYLPTRNLAATLSIRQKTELPTGANTDQLRRRQPDSRADCAAGPPWRVADSGEHEWGGMEFTNIPALPNGRPAMGQLSQYNHKQRREAQKA